MYKSKGYKSPLSSSLCSSLRPHQAWSIDVKQGRLGFRRGMRRMARTADDPSIAGLYTVYEKWMKKNEDERKMIW